MTNDSDPRKERFSLTDATHILTNAKFKNLLTIIVYINKENTQNIKYGAHQIFANSDIHSSTLFSVERSWLHIDLMFPLKMFIMLLIYALPTYLLLVITLIE